MPNQIGRLAPSDNKRIQGRKHQDHRKNELRLAASDNRHSVKLSLNGGHEKRFRSLLRPPERRIEHYYREETKPGPKPEVPRWPVQN
jgi:hypothetical protein